MMGWFSKNMGTVLEGARDMKNKVCIVTGANTGIGKETALALAKLDAHVILACRNQDKCKKARDDIVAVTSNEKVECAELDLASFDSIRTFSKSFLDRQIPLDVLINNAGMLPRDRQETVDGFEMTFGTNHLGPFLLTNLLLTKLKESAPSRIVNVASKAHAKTSMSFDDLQGEKSFWLWKAYCQSKLANVLFSFELDRKLKQTGDADGVTVNTLHPGVIQSDLWRTAPIILRWLIAPIAMALFISCEKGAVTQTYLAVSPEVEGISGQYFDKCKAVEASKDARNEQDAQKLWELSEKMTGLV